jgi:DNA-binding PadR family transcriptional regulator
MTADLKRDTLRKTILELLKNNTKHYTKLQKKVCATCHQFATANTFQPQLQYLLNNGFVERISRGVYQITPKGEKYLELWNSNSPSH